MITWYSKASDGAFCKHQFENWDLVNHALLMLESSTKYKFRTITRKEFNELRKKKWIQRVRFRVHPGFDDSKTIGFYTEYVFKRTNKALGKKIIRRNNVHRYFTEL